jgi:hypothetical protein
MSLIGSGLPSGLPHGMALEYGVVELQEMLLRYNARCITLGVQSLV